MKQVAYVSNLVFNFSLPSDCALAITEKVLEIKFLISPTMTRTKKSATKKSGKKGVQSLLITTANLI